MSPVNFRKISVFGFVALLAFAVFSASAQHSTAQTSAPLKSDKYLNDTSVISGDPCGPPCFANITVGKTKFNDAVTTIKSNKAFANVVTQQSPVQAAWTTAAGEQCCQMSADDTGTVSAVLLRLAPNVTAKQLLDKFGNPTYITEVDYSAAEVAVALIFPKVGLVAWVTPGDANSALTPDSPLVVALYLAQDQFNKLIAGATLQGWDGYKPYAAYKASPAIVTPLPAPTVPPQPTIVASAHDQDSPCYNAQPPNIQPPANAPKQFSAPEQVIDPTHTYCAFITTEHGVIVLELYAKYAPKHVNSFTFLANNGFYDGLTWHRVIAGFVAQTGDPTGTGSGGPGYTIPLETNPSLKYDRAGILGMARTNDPNSAGSQFFITYAPLPNLDAAPGSPGYTIFGRVVRGLEIAQQIRPRDQGDPPGDKLVSIRVLDATTGK